MNSRVRLLTLVTPAFALGFFASWIISHHRFSAENELVHACATQAQEVADSCREADRRRAIFEKKFPKTSDAALKSSEWERSVAWAQACNDAKARLEEAILINR